MKDTYGVIVYQEHVMRAAQALAGYSLQQADILRAAMGKKNKAAMEKEREGFIKGAVKTGLSKDLASTIFSKIETFAAYGFPRAHGAAYALTSYRTAYLRAHYPREFMAALLTLDMDDQSKTYKNIAALREMKIGVLPPDVNQSGVKFTVAGEAIRFGLAGIRGVGVKTSEAIIANREEKERLRKFDGLLHLRIMARSIYQPAGARSAGQMRRVRFHRRQPRDAVRPDRRLAQDRAARTKRCGEEPDWTLRRLRREIAASPA